MQKEFYDKLAAPFEQSKKKRSLLLRTNTIITRLVYLIYAALLVVLFFMRDERLLRVILVPALSFAAVTVFRKACNAPRPYEVWDTPPLITKDTKGNSFPSRHVFSIYIIAMAMIYIQPVPGLLLIAAGILLAAVRVIARVHFLKDVIAGAAIGTVAGWIGFWCIPL